MDQMTMLREFRAELAEEDPRARAAAWRALEARFDVAVAAEAADGPSWLGAAPPRTRRHRPLAVLPRGGRRRRVLALTGVVAVAAVVVAIVGLGSGSTTPPAAAEVLRRTAAVAAAAGKAPQLPGPGQFLYSKVKMVELEGWVPNGRQVSGGGQLKYRDAFNADITTVRESWGSPHGGGREREVMAAPPRLVPQSDRGRWKREGSPLPGQLDPKKQREYAVETKGHGPQVIEARRGVYDIKIPRPPGRGPGPNFGFPDYSRLPTRPEALRRAIQSNQFPGVGNAPHGVHEPLDTKETIETLFGLLSAPNVTPALRAATFNALAEMPGIELRTDATDLIGRHADAIRYYDAKYGWANEYFFDPDTAEVLGDRWVVVKPGVSPSTDGLPAGLVKRESALIRSGVVDTERERVSAQGVRATGS
jgi:hypothetical protein